MANILNPETIEKVRRLPKIGKYETQIQESFGISSRLETVRRETWSKVLVQPALEMILNEKIDGVFINELNEYEIELYYCFEGRLFELYYFIDEVEFEVDCALIECNNRLEVINFPIGTTPWQWETENC